MSVKQFINKLLPAHTMKIQYKGRELYINSKDEGVAYALIYTERFEDEVINTIRERVRRDMTCLDIGANLGLMAIEMAAKGADVYAFEPDHYNYHLLKRNLRANRLNASTFNIAMLNHGGYTEFYYDHKNLGNHSVAASNIEQPSGRTHVFCSSIDEFFKTKIDFIKVDTQGCDYHVLKGGTQSIMKWHPEMIVEYYPKGLLNMGILPGRLLEFISELGYEYETIDYPIPADNTGYCNLLCTPKGVIA